MTDFEAPFRWDITRRHRLGNLTAGDRADTYPGFETDLLACCARLLAFAGDSELVFIGRSPESLFDHLSGLLYDTSWFERLMLIHFSIGYREESKLRAELPGAVPALRAYFEQSGLSPRQLVSRKRPVALLDLVDSGETFGRLVGFLATWSDETGCNWQAVRAKLRLVGITERTKTSPNTWRWQQRVDWIDLIGTRNVKNVSIPDTLWTYLGNCQDKVSQSYPPERWGDPIAANPSYQPEQLKALRLAHHLFELGRSPQQRQTLLEHLAREPAMNQDWFRHLILEVRNSGA